MIHRFSNLLLVLMITCSICLNNLKRTLPAVKRVQISSSKRPMKERVISTSITTTKKRIYTQIDLYEIQRILKLRPDDFYGILNLKTVKSEEHLMKAYRKYSLLVHPDRNAAPGADEAMQRVNAARDYFLNKLQEYYQDYDADGYRRAPHTESISTASPRKSSSSSTLTTMKKSASKQTTTIFFILFVIIGCFIGLVVYWQKRKTRSLLVHRIDDENSDRRDEIERETVLVEQEDSTDHKD